MAKKRYIYKKKKIHKLSPGTAKAVKNMIVKTINKRTEFKQYAASLTQTEFYNGAGASIGHITAIGQGTADNQRLGDEVYVQSLHMRFLLRNGIGATANEFNLARIMIFQYTSQDNAPSASELLLASNVPAVAARCAMSSRDIDYLNLYHVLYDKTFLLNQGTPNAANYGNGGAIQRYVQFSVPLKKCKRKIQWESAGAGTVNGLYYCVIGLHATTDIDPTFATNFSLSFTDS